jgi:hypothetical protein
MGMPAAAAAALLISINPSMCDNSNYLAINSQDFLHLFINPPSALHPSCHGCEALLLSHLIFTCPPDGAPY